MARTRPRRTRPSRGLAGSRRTPLAGRRKAPGSGADGEPQERRVLVSATGGSGNGELSHRRTSFRRGTRSGYVTSPVRSRKSFERCGDEPWQRAQDVAALEDRRALGSESFAPPGELAETVLGHVHRCERIVHMSVEAGGHDDELRLERAHRGLDDVVEGAPVVLVPAAGREGNVQGRVALVVRATASRIERPLVQRDEEDGRVVAEDLLGDVPVMNVPVDYRDSLETELGLGMAGRDRDVVEEADRKSGV